MARIAVCGGSYMSADVRIPGGHFSEILRNKYNFDVVNLARTGISNIGICFQIEQAIQLQPTTIIVGIGDSGRIEVPVGKFRERLGLKNIRYTNKFDVSNTSPYVGNAHAPIISDTLPAIIGEEADLVDNYILPKETRQAAKQYFSYLYDADLKMLTDSWALHYWYQKCKENNIRVIEVVKEVQMLLTAQITNTTPWIFHTDLETQDQAAKLLNTLITRN